MALPFFVAYSPYKAYVCAYMYMLLTRTKKPVSRLQSSPKTSLFLFSKCLSPSLPTQRIFYAIYSCYREVLSQTRRSSSKYIGRVYFDPLQLCRAENIYLYHSSVASYNRTIRIVIQFLCCSCFCWCSCCPISGPVWPGRSGWIERERNSLWQQSVSCKPVIEATGCAGVSLNGCFLPYVASRQDRARCWTREPHSYAEE